MPGLSPVIPVQCGLYRLKAMTTVSPINYMGGGGGGVDISLVFGGDRMAGDALPDEEQQPSSVQGGQGQQIDNPPG